MSEEKHQLDLAEAQIIWWLQWSKWWTIVDLVVSMWLREEERHKLKQEYTIDGDVIDEINEHFYF